MDRPNKNYQHTHPQNIHYRFKRKHDATLLTPSTSTGVLGLEKRQRVDNRQEGQESTSGEEGPGGYIGLTRTSEPVVANPGTHGSHTQAQVHDPSLAQPPHSEVPADVKQSNTILQNAQGVNISGNPNFHNIGSVTNIYGGGTNGLDNLNGFISFEAQFDSSAQDPDRKCHPGTRQNVLKRLRDWIDNPQSTERIFWLYGPAGAGKSAIAQTIARLYDRPKVAGTFFFFRSDVNRNDGNRLFTTLAYQLASSMPKIRDYIAHSLCERPDLPRADVETQFNQLIARPFQVLSNDSTQQLAPVVHVIIDIVKKYQELAPVIVIDGIDECMDESLQRRFLKVIGDAVKDDRLPLRFLIVSRPEVHIEHTIRRFQTPILTIDLADLDDANRDIEKYLVDEFSRIASEQGLGSTWPGPEIIRDIVYKSSGNFIYASVVIRFVGDPYYFAKTQLEIVMNMKPPKTMSPFAALDQLFLEILRRVPDQDFLKRYLALLTARISVSNDYGDLYKDDAVLMHVSEQELYANLRRMRSLLKFEPFIDVHHKSFLDFLHSSSRSGQYYIRNQGRIRQYLEFFVESLVQHVSTVIELPDHHNVPHFTPKFRATITVFPPKTQLPINEWPEVIQPLLDLQDKILQLPNFSSTWHLLACDECTSFRLLRELLYLGVHGGVFHGFSFCQSVINVRNRTGIVSSTATTKRMNGNDLDSLLVSLFAHYPATTENWSLTSEVIKLVSAILGFDCAETATRVRFVSDAQKLIDILYYLISENNVLGRIHPDAARKATLLALETFARVPVFPRSFSFIGNFGLKRITRRYASIPIEVAAQTIFASEILDYRYIAPLFAVESGTSCSGDLNEISMKEWRKEIIPSPVTAIQIMLGLAKAIQYLHSLGVILDRKFGLADVFLDSDLCPKIRCLYSTSRFLLDEEWKVCFLPADNLFLFGCIFYELYSAVDTSLFIIEDRRSVVTNRLSVPYIPEFVWQLIQRCCAEDPQDRPLIDAVVQEMEGWNIE